MALQLERVTAFNPVCSSTYTFDREIDVDELRESFRQQCAVFPKYRQSLAFKPSLFAGPYYEDDPNFNIDRHFQVFQLPEPAGPEQLNDFVCTIYERCELAAEQSPTILQVSKYISQDWDESRPLWSAAYLPNYRNGRAKGAMVSRGHHTQSDGQGFIMSALYITSYGKTLQRMMDDGNTKLYAARRGLLRPSDMSPYLRHLNQFHGRRATRLPVQVLLFGLYWTIAAVEAYQRCFYSIVHLFYGIFGYLLTFWRIDMVVPRSDSPRESVYALSQPLPISEVKTIQQAFSGNTPGHSQSGFLGHVTLNDVLCSVMADVIAQAIDRVPKDGSWNRIKQVCGHFIPMPITFFM